jgi:hypothetical protein
VSRWLTSCYRTIKTTAGFSASLSSLNYSLYLLAYLHAQAPSRATLIARLSKILGRDVKLPPKALAPTTSPLLPLGLMVADFRTTLRLTGLLSLYALLKSLLLQKGGDPLKHKILLVQCLGYIGFQATENILQLTNKGVLQPTLVARLGGAGGAANVMKWACRSWLVGVSTDFFRLWRDATLMRERKTRERVSREEEEQFDAKWWADLQTCTAWLPVAIHYSVEGGLTGMNQGIVGFCGLMAGLNNFRAAWKGAAA